MLSYFIWVVFKDKIEIKNVKLVVKGEDIRFVVLVDGSLFWF